MGLDAEVQLLLGGMGNGVATEIHLRVAGYNRFQRISQLVALVGKDKRPGSFAVLFIASQLVKYELLINSKIIYSSYRNLCQCSHFKYKIMFLRLVCLQKTCKAHAVTIDGWPIDCLSIKQLEIAKMKINKNG